VMLLVTSTLSVLHRCWLGVRKDICPAKIFQQFMQNFSNWSLGGRHLSHKNPAIFKGSLR